MSLLLVSMGLSVVGALAAILTGKSEKVSQGMGVTFGVLAALSSLGAGLTPIFGGTEYVCVATPFAFAPFSILLNPLSGLLIAVISALALLAWIYGLSYFKEYSGRGIGSIGFFMNLFIAAMIMVIAVDSAFWFLVFFEVMSLTSYFLVIVEQTKESTRAGFMYFVMAHIGYLLIMIAFLVMSSIAGSFDFEAFRQTDFGVAIAATVFLLTFFGFGIKAGMVPFHSWLPLAHPAAPSNVSALMSGGMIKIGVFGIIKVGLDLLAGSGCELWWGVLILVMGAISAVFGIVYALAENDIKRLLAYSSVENIGIILMGVGLCFIGVALGQPTLAGLGLMAALYHLVNHAMFKGLLFLGAGSVLYSAHTRDLQKLGGLVKAMPVTAMCFLIGSLAIAALPPLNGFVSEWFTYQALFNAAFLGNSVVMAFAAVTAASLVITGALALACFVKAYGITFLGPSRSNEARKAKEVPFAMKFAMVALATVCILLGVGAPWVAPVMENIASAVLQADATTVASGVMLLNPDTGDAVSTPLIAVLLIGLIALPVIARALFARGGKNANRDAWACGYQTETEMSMISSSFGSEVQKFMSPLYELREVCVRFTQSVATFFKGSVRGAAAVEPLGDRYLVNPLASFVSWSGRLVQKIEGGNFRLYITYIVVILIFFLVLAVVVN